MEEGKRERGWSNARQAKRKKTRRLFAMERWRATFIPP